MNAAVDLREHARHLHNKHDLALIAQALGGDTLTRRVADELDEIGPRCASLPVLDERPRS